MSVHVGDVVWFMSPSAAKVEELEADILSVDWLAVVGSRGGSGSGNGNLGNGNAHSEM